MLTNVRLMAVTNSAWAAQPAPITMVATYVPVTLLATPTTKQRWIALMWMSVLGPAMTWLAMLTLLAPIPTVLSSVLVTLASSTQQWMELAWTSTNVKTQRSARVHLHVQTMKVLIPANARLDTATMEPQWIVLMWTNVPQRCHHAMKASTAVTPMVPTSVLRHLQAQTVRSLELLMKQT
jgi:hypothetical protein